MDPAQGIDRVTDLLLADGVVAGIGEGFSADEVIEAGGTVVTPGFLDIHVHLREPGFEKAETIESGGWCAAESGFTSVCCMPNTKPVNDSAEVTRYIVETAKAKSPVNVFPIGAISKSSLGEELADLAGMRAAGAVAFSDDGRPVMNSGIMRRAMETARALDAPIVDHCEDLGLTVGATMHEGLASSRLAQIGMPGAAEDIMVSRDLILAELTGVRYHVAHISTRASIELVRQAKRLGMPVTCEITPHHFTIADTDFPGLDAGYKMKPPLRACVDIDAAMHGITTGVIDSIATDHAPHPPDEKALAFERCPFGILGLETAIGLALERLVHPGLITLRRMVELFTTGAERTMRLGRGTLRVGAPGDVTIFDLNRKWTYDVSRTKSRSRNTPFDGRVFQGGPLATIVQGRLIWRHASFS
jgi:dihydroorotase